MGVFAAPTSESAVREAVLDATAQGVALRIIGGGTRSTAAELSCDHQDLDLSGLTGVDLYEPGALTLVAKPGTSLAETKQMLADNGQQLAFEPNDLRDVLGTVGASTLGGVVATNASGPRRLLVGACRDHLLGIRFVDGSGNTVKSGGRVMKNVTGLDLAKLHCGGRGSLGVLTEIALKVLPKPETSVTLSIPDLPAKSAVEVFSKALRTPYEVSGASWYDNTAHIRIEGLETQVKYRSDQLKTLLSEFEIETQVAASNASLWNEIGDAKSFAGGPGSIWRLSAKATSVPHILDEIQRVASFEVILDRGGSLAWIRFREDGIPADKFIHDALQGEHGYAIQVRPDNAKTSVGKTVPELHQRLRDLSVSLKRRVDPAGLFNPGILVA